MMKDFYKQILQDVAIDLTDEFDQNFERKGFFNKKWKGTRMAYKKGSLMLRTATLRRSIQHRIMQNSITWKSSQPYASIHNEGGEIVVTAQMKKYFWAMYYKSAGKIKTSESKTFGLHVKLNDRNVGLAKESQGFKAMALMKVGSKIIMPERRFIGDHPEVRKAIERNTDATMQELDLYLTELLRQK